MQEFLVEITTTIPDGADIADVEARRAAEAARAKELAATGNLVRLWRPVGELRPIRTTRCDGVATICAAVDDRRLHRRPEMGVGLRPNITIACARRPF